MSIFTPGKYTSKTEVFFNKVVFGIMFTFALFLAICMIVAMIVKPLFGVIVVFLVGAIYVLGFKVAPWLYNKLAD